METFSRETSQNHHQDLNPWYVTGLVDGEGSFTFSRNGLSLALYFSLKLPAKDRPLLERLQRYFNGAGRIYTVRPHEPKGLSTTKRESCLYRATRISELAAVVAHFDAFPLLGPKAESYQIWREMYAIKTRFRRGNWTRLQQLAVELSAASPRKRPFN